MMKDNDNPDHNSGGDNRTTPGIGFNTEAQGQGPPRSLTELQPIPPPQGPFPNTGGGGVGVSQAPSMPVGPFSPSVSPSYPAPPASNASFSAPTPSSQYISNSSGAPLAPTPSPQYIGNSSGAPLAMRSTANSVPYNPHQPTAAAAYSTNTLQPTPPQPPKRVNEEAQSEEKSAEVSDATMNAILAYLRKNNLNDTESKLKEELKKREAANANATQSDPEVGNVLATYRSDGDPSSYGSAYR